MAQSRVFRWLQWLLMAIGVFGMLYLLLLFIQPYRFQMTLSEKRGRVVDAQTGKGLADVAVVVNYESTFFTPFRTSSDCLHQKILRTDAEGYYFVPDASKDVDVADGLLLRMLPGFSESYGWVLLYYKEGYASPQEIERRLDRIEGRAVRSTVPRERYTWDGSAYIVPPVQMQRLDMTSAPSMADAYISHIGSLAVRMSCMLFLEESSEEFRRLHKDMETSVKQLICELPSDKVLAQEAMRFSFTDCAASMGMKRIRERKGSHAALTTGDMCESYSYVPSEFECRGLGGKRPPLKVVTKPASKSAGSVH
ncbi:MAG: hypothetical protein DI564_15920 [Rhodanobacter denitrificans]|uniref:Uncharacterized protein n=1 Tax=Rhodanobacter denitrificans TaxID=666685 RepID=A0A2W5K4L5_9GAMM|nr:MAG: hypothetical protein DI564_15920 [Rhodanobacter denitrificans]